MDKMDNNANKDIGYSEEMHSRLWQHKMSINQDFTAFGNIFLVAESILLATVGALLGSASSPKPIVYVLTILGLAITTVWGIVQSKQRRLLLLLKDKCKVEFPEYRDTHIARKGVFDRISNIWLLTFVVPSIFWIAWFCIAFVLAFRS